jgi:hypothetical protein
MINFKSALLSLFDEGAQIRTTMNIYGARPRLLCAKPTAKLLFPGSTAWKRTEDGLNH